MEFSSILNFIGSTPLVLLERLNPNPSTTLLAKVEGMNPTGSAKDRVALNMVRHAEESGQLLPGQTLVDATCGSAGVSLAMVGACLGYPARIFMPESANPWYKTAMETYGAQVTLTPAQFGMDGALAQAAHLAEKYPARYCYLNQHQNPENPMAHFDTTAQELWQQTAGEITHLVAPVGTSGTLMGISAGLKAKNPAIEIVEAHPVPGHTIPGLCNFQEEGEPYSYAAQLVDRRIMVDTQQALQAQTSLAVKEGISAGLSSGAALAAAISFCKNLDLGTVVVVLPSRRQLM